MLEGPELEKEIKEILTRLGIVNTKYIRKIAAQIRKIGELNQSSINRLAAMSEMNADIGEISDELRLTLAVSNRTLMRIYEKAMQEAYTDPRFKAYLSENPDAIRPDSRQRITNYVRAVYRQTAGTLANFSNTTALTPMYSEAIDRAILATSTGVASYTETMRDTVRKIGHAGMQVQYESGYHRRLDTAVRQNIVDGVNQINKNASIMIGEALGYDAIEISAHARSAPDHEPVQGHVFLLAEFQQMQTGSPFRDIDGNVFEGFRRPIGEWNCRHTPMSFSTKWSKRKWTDEQLQAFIDENHAGCEIDGKHKTLYEAMQMMRDIETAVRREKDAAIAAQAAGDDTLRQECQRNINALVKRYSEIAKASGNAEKRQRMVVDGFKSVKVTPDNENDLTTTAESGTINKKIRFYNLYENERFGAYSVEEIETAMQSSPIGQNASEFFSNYGFSLEMNYDPDAPLGLMGQVRGRDMQIFTINHNDALEISQTIVHEVAHVQFGWDNTQEDEVNCMIYDYLHIHNTISEATISEIVALVREKYPDLPEGNLYGY